MPCPGPAFSRAARGARGCSLGDYDRMSRAVTCTQCQCHGEGTALCHRAVPLLCATALCHCSASSQTCPAHPPQPDGQNAPASQQGTARQCLPGEILSSSPFRLLAVFKSLEGIYINASKTWSSKNEQPSENNVWLLGNSSLGKTSLFEFVTLPLLSGWPKQSYSSFSCVYRFSCTLG